MNMLREVQELDGASPASPTATAIILSNLFLFFLVFGLAATVSVRSLSAQLSNKAAIITGLFMQFLIMPLLGFTAVMIFKSDQDGLSQAMGITLLVVTSSPGGSYSNWWCALFNADLALSVAMTACSTVLSVGMLPANLALYSYLAYGRGGDNNNLVGNLDFETLFISLGIVMGAICLGLYTSYKIDSVLFRVWCNRGANVSGVALIVISFLLSSVGTETNIWSQDWKFYVAVAIPCFVGLFLANFLSSLARLDKPERVAVAIECCYQNTGIATSVAVTMFSDPEERARAVAVPLFYGICEAFIVLIYCLFAWKAGWTRAPVKENCCTVISTNYEITDQEDKEEDVEEDANHDLGDLPRIIEEDLPRWQFWRRRTDSDFDEAMDDEENNHPKKKELSRNRLVSEDNTVATGTTSASSGKAEEKEEL